MMKFILFCGIDLLFHTLTPKASVLSFLSFFLSFFFLHHPSRSFKAVNFPSPPQPTPSHFLPYLPPFPLLDIPTLPLTTFYLPSHQLVLPLTSSPPCRC